MTNPQAVDPIVPGKDAWKTVTKGEIVGNLQWYEDEPCLVLTSARPKPGGGVFIIAESAIPRYVASHGRGERHAAKAALFAAMRLGYARTDKYVIHNILDCIYDWLPHLVEMPPKPEILKRVRDEAIVSINGKESLRQRVI